MRAQLFGPDATHWGSTRSRLLIVSLGCGAGRPVLRPLPAVVWRLWPELHQVAVPQEVASEFARVELGTDLILSRPELIETLGWRHARRAAIGMLPSVTEGYLAEDTLQVDQEGRDRDARLDHLPTDDSGPLMHHDVDTA